MAPYYNLQIRICIRKLSCTVHRRYGPVTVSNVNKPLNNTHISPQNSPRCNRWGKVNKGENVHMYITLQLLPVDTYGAERDTDANLAGWCINFRVCRALVEFRVCTFIKSGQELLDFTQENPICSASQSSSILFPFKPYLHFNRPQINPN